MSIFDDRATKSNNIFADRGTGKSSKSEKTTRDYDEKRTVSGAKASSMMQGILTIKEDNERKAAGVIADYMRTASMKTFNESALLNDLSKLLNGFTTEEQNRILMKAFVVLLTDIS